MPGPPPESHAEAIARYEKEMGMEKELFTMDSGTLSDIDIDPVILKEVQPFFSLTYFRSCILTMFPARRLSCT